MIGEFRASDWNFSQNSSTFRFILFDESSFRALYFQISLLIPFTKDYFQLEIYVFFNSCSL